MPPGSDGPGKTRDKAAAALGVSGKTYEKAKKVQQAAEREPEKCRDLPLWVNVTGLFPLAG